MMKHVAAHLRGANDEGYERFKRICHAIGPAIIAPLAEALSSEQDARARRRLRDILVGFGAQGRESVQQLMNAPNWEVRRTAAFLLREFGGTEGLKELVPLLTDSEPLVQREAVQGLMMNGSDGGLGDPAARADEGHRPRARNAASTSCCRCATSAPRRSLLSGQAHASARSSRASTSAAVEALGTFGGARRRRGAEVRAASRRILGAAAHAGAIGRRRPQALREIGTPAALDALRAHPRAVRAACGRRRAANLPVLELNTGAPVA